jgi:hypothetical protein
VVPDGDRLLLLLRRVRRRLLAQKSLQGALAGALYALVAGDFALLLLRSGVAGLMTSLTPWLAIFAFALALCGGVAWVIGRDPITLGEAARRVDAAAAGGHGPSRDDRVFVGLFLRARTDCAFARAAVEDAIRRTKATPMASVAPWRRPRGLGLMAAFASVAAGLAFWPWPSSSESGLEPGNRPARPVAAAPENEWRDVRTELDRLQRAAVLLNDGQLIALLAEVDGLLRQGSTAGPKREETLRRLAALATAARASAESSAALAEAFAEVGDILATVPQTRAWGEALSRLQARASEREAQAAASRVPKMSAEERKELAEALAQAAAATQPSSDPQADRQRRESGAEEKRRRLAGLQAPPPAAPSPRPEREPASPPSTDRSLRRLERDLQDSADACQRNPEACARAVGQAAESLGSEMPRARSSSERSQLARALEQELARQGEQGEARADQGGEPASAPTGELSSAGAAGSRGTGRITGAGREAGTGPGTAVGRAAGNQEAGAEPGTGTATGAGVGAGPGAGGVGTEERAFGGQGEKREVRVQSGPGPSRAEIIEAGARRGFAEPSYGRVFREYQAAVEESLDATAVPAGRRSLVRRYFDLIHPR